MSLFSQYFSKLFSKIITTTLLKNAGVLLLFIHPEYKDLTKGAILVYRDPKRASVYNHIVKIKKKINTKLGYSEAYQIYRCVEAVKKTRGDMAEVGVYKGGSATIISETDKTKVLHLFDTFKGLPKTSKNDNSYFYEGQFEGTINEVKNNLKKHKNVRYHKGYFPTTTASLKNKRFSFVHLDVDIYTSTKDALKFFYPRLNKGGIIISHDYISSAGVRKAFDQYFKYKKEPVVEISGGSQCLIIKT